MLREPWRPSGEAVEALSRRLGSDATQLRRAWNAFATGDAPRTGGSPDTRARFVPHGYAILFPGERSMGDGLKTGSVSPRDATILSTNQVPHAPFGWRLRPRVSVGERSLDEGRSTGEGEWTVRNSGHAKVERERSKRAALP